MVLRCDRENIKRVSQLLGNWTPPSPHRGDNGSDIIYGVINITE